MTSRDSFLDNVDLPDSQRRAVDRRRREQGFRGGGGSPIRRETQQEREQRQRQTALSNLQRELAETGSRLTQAETKAILEGRSASEVRQQIVGRQRREDLSNLQKELSRTGARLSAAEAQSILEGRSVKAVREQVFTRAQRTQLDQQRREQRLEAQKAAAVRQVQSRQELRVSDQATKQTTTVNNKPLPVISELPPATSLSQKVRRAAQEKELLRTGAGATAAGAVSGFIGIGEGIVATIKNPIQTAKAAKDAGAEFLRGGNPLPDFELQNPQRGDFGFGVIAAETLVFAGTPTVVGAVRRRTSSPSVESVTKGTTTTVAGTDTAVASGRLQTVSVANKRKFFLTDTVLRSAEVIQESTPNVRVTQTGSQIQRVNKKAQPKGAATDSRSLTVENIIDDAATGRQTVVGQRVSEVDGRVTRERTAGVAQQVTDDFSIAATAAVDTKGRRQLSAQAAKDIVSGEIPIVQNVGGLVVEQLRQGRVSEVRAATVSGKSVDQVLSDLRTEITLVDQARGRRPTDTGAGAARTQQQQKQTSTEGAVSQLNEQVTEAVKSLVVEDQVTKARTAAKPVAASPALPNERETTLKVSQEPTQQTTPTVTSSKADLDALNQNNVFVLPAERTRSLEALTATDTSLDEAVGGRSATRRTTRSATQQDTTPALRLDTKPAQEQLPRQRQAQATQPALTQAQGTGLVPRAVTPARPTRPLRPKKPLLPSLNMPKGVTGSPLFRVVVGRKGNKVFQDLGTGGVDLIKKGRDAVKNTAAATLQIQAVRGSVPKSELQSILGDTFSESKSLDDAFVEDRDERISTSGELRDITFAPRTKTKQGLTGSDKKTNEAIKLVGKGKSLRSVRELLK